MEHTEELIVGHIYLERDRDGWYSEIVGMEDDYIDYRRFLPGVGWREVRKMPVALALKEFERDVTGIEGFQNISGNISNRERVRRGSRGDTGAVPEDFDKVNPRHPLAPWHDVLLERLEDLKRRKQKENPGLQVPVFGIELVGDDIGELEEAIVNSYRTRGFKGNTPALPWVVLASEIGMDFEGQEYWDMFAARTGGCAASSVSKEREILTVMFEWFEQRHGGARPHGQDVAGTWADSKVNICWPVTHSILPTRFQRQLWDAIMEISKRGSDNLEYLLFHPIDFANAIAAEHLRVAQSPERFCAFAKDNHLLGEIAIAFFTNDSDEFTGSSKTIDDRAFQRIIGYLEENVVDFKREAEELKTQFSVLYNAVSAVIRRRRRIQAGETGEPSEDIDDVILRELMENAVTEKRSLRLEIEPTIDLVWDGETWTPRISIPSLKPLVECFPGERDQIERSTVTAAGVDVQGSLLLGSPQIRSFPRMWPSPNQSLLTIKGNAKNTNRILNRFLDFTWQDDPAIFKIDKSESRAQLVTNRKMVLGEKYVLVSRRPMNGQFFQPVNFSCDNAKAYLLDLPSYMTREEAEEVVGPYEIGIRRNIRIGPVGLTALSSDDERHHWIKGDPLVMSVQSDISFDRLTVTSGNPAEESLELTTYDAENQTLFTVDTERIGTHQYWVEWISGDESDLIPFEVVVREPIPFQDSYASDRYPTQLVTQPISPNMEQLWNKNLRLELRGINGISGHFEVDFLGHDGNPVGQCRLEIPIALPVSPNEWDSIFQRDIKSNPIARESYEDADAIRLTFNFGDWGLHVRELKRGLPTMRWQAALIGGKYQVALDGPVDVKNLRVQGTKFEHPTELVRLDRDELLENRVPGEVGLYVATWLDYRCRGRRCHSWS